MSLILLAAVLGVLVRLALRHDANQETMWVFTAGLVAFVAGSVLGSEYVGDHRIDEAASTLVGENISDQMVGSPTVRTVASDGARNRRAGYSTHDEPPTH